MKTRKEIMHQVYKDALVRIESGRSMGMCAAVNDSTPYIEPGEGWFMPIPVEIHKHNPFHKEWARSAYRLVFGRKSWPWGLWYPVRGWLGAGYWRRKRIAILKKCIEETKP